jgi:hypothetical protein
MQLIATNWRKADAITWLLLEICKLDKSDNNLNSGSGSINTPSLPKVDGRAIKAFLIKRQVICQLVDIFSSEQSPLKGVMYVQGTRKTAPDSYVVIGPPTSRDGPLPLASKNIPDWGHLLETLSLLVEACKTEYMNDPGSPPPSLFSPSKSVMEFPPFFDHFSNVSVTSRTLYSIALGQCRYTTPVTSLILHLAFDSVPFSDMVSELLFEV